MKLLRIIIVALSATTVVGAYAQTIDQNQPDAFFDMANFSQTDLAQSFKQSANNIDGAGIRTAPSVGAGDNLTISLYNNLPNQGGNLLASGTYMNAQAGQWVDVFWNPVNITSGSTYYLVFTSNNNTMGISGSIFNPYPDGESYANPGYQGFSGYDYAFRTYHGAITPEPAPIAALGIGAVCLIRRRRSS